MLDRHNEGPAYRVASAVRDITPQRPYRPRLLFAALLAPRPTGIVLWPVPERAAVAR